MHTNRVSFGTRWVRRATIVAEASTLCLASSAAMAAVVTCPVSNLAVPATFDGIYINLVTGATGTTGATTPGWDVDPYGQTGTLYIFWSGSPADSTGGVVAPATTTPLLVLGPGDTIDAASTFTRSVAAASSFRVTQDAFVGLRFFNENTSAINFGYVELNTVGPGGFPATLVSCFYEDTGAGITIPALPLDEIFVDGFEQVIIGLQ